MTRGVGLHRLVGEVPEAAVAVAGVLTQLGDPWFLLVAVGAVYAGAALGTPLVDDPRRDCLYLLSLVVGAYALTVLLKHAIALPRPPGAGTATPPPWLPVPRSVYAVLVTADGYGFPSGHAVMSTAVYGAWALVLRVRTPAWRRRAAGAVIATVGATRLVLGVHYLVDVVAGVAVGAALLWTAERFVRRVPARALLLAGGLCAPAAAVAWFG